MTDCTPNGPSRASPVASQAVSFTVVLAVWLAVLVALAFIRYRSMWRPYRRLHEWAADSGVPDAVRHLDYPLIVLLVVLFAVVVARVLAKVRVAEALALRGPGWAWAIACLVSLSPMVFGGLALLLLSDGTPPHVPDAVKGVVRAPLLEELMFRGVLVALPMAVWTARGVPRARFWALAALSALLFAAFHVPWTGPGLMQGWAVLLVTFAGGVWFAWLLRASGSLWVPTLMHAGMNLGWLLAGGGSAAGGGWVEHALRAVTIASLTVWAVAYGRRPRAA